MILADIMDALAGAISTSLLPQSKSYAYPVESLVPPAIVVGYPTTIDYDVTFARGADRMVVPVWYVVSKTRDKTARDAISTAISSATEVKLAVEGNATLLTKADTVRVTGATPSELLVGAVSYLSVKFDVEVIA